jgi:hypothetical protein
MPILKLPRGLQLNKTHSLARGLIACWLFNELTGNKVCDLSSTGANGSLQGNPAWAAGKFSGCLDFNGTSDYIDIGTFSKLNNATAFTFSFWFKPHQINFSGHQGIIGFGPSDQRVPWIWGRNDTDKISVQFETTTGGTGDGNLDIPNIVQDIWQHICITWDGKIDTGYLDAIIKDADTTEGSILGDSTATNYLAYASNIAKFDGQIDHIMAWNRCLSADEVVLLYREPFCMLGQAKNPAVLFVPTINLAGISTAQSTISATLQRVRRIKGSSAATAEVAALLKIIGEALITGSTEASSGLSGKLTLSYHGPWLSKMLKIERQWLTDALFNGMTANAFKLSTVISCGWFWVRPNGCTVLYRGTAMEKIDFTSILSVAEQKTESMSLPDFIPQNNNSTYFYVIRRFNNYGCQERTLQAAVKIEIDTEGNLAEPLPNNIFAWRADQVDGNKVQLIWFYSPLEQMSKPVHFKVYYDGGTGQINYENPIATIGYQGRKFYCWQSEALPGNKYLFTVKAEDINGIENNSLGQLAIDIVGDGPDEIEILKVETL